MVNIISKIKIVYLNTIYYKLPSEEGNRNPNGKEQGSSICSIHIIKKKKKVYKNVEYAQMNQQLTEDGYRAERLL